jgi:hypothetical protein
MIIALSTVRQPPESRLEQAPFAPMAIMVPASPPAEMINPYQGNASCWRERMRHAQAFKDDMETISSYLANDRARCDALFAPLRHPQDAR